MEFEYCIAQHVESSAQPVVTGSAGPGVGDGGGVHIRVAPSVDAADSAKK